MITIKRSTVYIGLVATLLSGSAVMVVHAQQATPTAPLASPLQLPTLAPVADAVLPSVVSIAVKGMVAQQQSPLMKDPFFKQFFNGQAAPAKKEEQAAGSGVIVDAAKGLIITNNHVVSFADEIEVTLSDGRVVPGKRLGADPDMDVALIQIPPDNLKAISFSPPQDLKVGDYVVAVGNPFGLGETVTSGIVSAMGRTGLGIEGYEDFIQTDAAINPGNSGGALVNLKGELVGINTAIVGPGGGSVGIGFAIPASMVHQVMDQIEKYGDVQRGQLGVGIQTLTPDLVAALGLPQGEHGAIVNNVNPGSAALAAGVQAGDLVTTVNGSAVASSSDLRNVVGLMRVGDKVSLGLLRAGKSLDVSVQLAKAVATNLAGIDVSPALDGATLVPVPADQGGPGVGVAALADGSPAQSEGLVEGDVITAVNQHEIKDLGDFSSDVKASPGKILLNITRDGAGMLLILKQA